MQALQVLGDTVRRNEMVRENKNTPQDSGPGVDANETVTLSDTLKDEGKWAGETADPEGTWNREPIDIRGDVEPDKKG